MLPVRGCTIQDSRKSFMRSSPDASLMPPRKANAIQFGSGKSGWPLCPETESDRLPLRRDYPERDTTSAEKGAEFLPKQREGAFVIKYFLADRSRQQQRPTR